jgi:branched-chain amino acid transport system ATP-binding protein
VRLAAEAASAARCGSGGARRLGATSRAARWALARVGLDERALPAGVAPHGDKRKLELAMLLARDRSVLLLDEPMAGVSARTCPGSSR